MLGIVLQEYCVVAAHRGVHFANKRETFTVLRLKSILMGLSGMNELAMSLRNCKPTFVFTAEFSSSFFLITPKRFFKMFFTKISDSARGVAGGDVIGNINIR